MDTIGTANQEMFKIDNTFQHTEVGGTDIGTIYIGKPDSSTATLMYGATEIRAGNAKLRINDVDGFELFDNDLKFIPTEIFQITNKDETGKPLFKIDTTTLGSEKLTSRIKDIEIQPLNEFIIKRNDDSATTPNVVNITDDIVALQTSIFDLTASDKITIKSITADATGEIKIDSSNKIILVSEDDIDIHTKTTMKIKPEETFVILDTIGTANQEMFKIDNTFQHTEVGGTDIGTIYIGKPDSSTATLMYGATEIRAGNAKLRINDVDDL